MSRAHRAPTADLAASPDRFIYGVGFNQDGERCYVVSLDICRKGNDDNQDLPDTNNELEGFAVVTSGVPLGTILPYDFPVTPNVKKPYALVRPEPGDNIDDFGFSDAHAPKLAAPVTNRSVLLLLDELEIPGQIEEELRDQAYPDLDHVTPAYRVVFRRNILHANNGARVVTADTRETVGMFLNAADGGPNGIVYPAHLFPTR